MQWTAEDNGEGASGPRYEIVLDTGIFLFSNAFVKKSGENLLFGHEGTEEYFLPGSMISVFYASDAEEALPEVNDFTADHGEFAVLVVLKARAAVRDFALFSLKYEGGEGENGPIFTETELYKLADMKPEKPLRVLMSFGEAFPSYGFVYTGREGERHSYGIMQSGKDGSVILVEIETAKG